MSTSDIEPSAPRSAAVFGGAGFIGTRMLALLEERGAERLISIDRRPPRRRSERVEHRIEDIRQPTSLNETVDVVYNFAAVHTTPGHEPHEYYEANVAGAINVTDYARRHGVKTIVFTSSISVYGPTEDQKDEATPPDPTSDYGRSKLLAEGIHRTWLQEDPSRRLVIVRPAVVFGHGEGGNFDRMLKLIRTRRFVYPGRTDTIKSCGWVGELVSSIEWVRDREEREAVFNFAYPERTTIKQIVDTVARLDGDPAPTINLPFKAMQQAALPFELLARVGLETGINRARLRKLVMSTNIYPRYLVEAGYPFTTRFEQGVEHWLADEQGRRPTRRPELTH